jgi:hypothetical protein
VVVASVCAYLNLHSTMLALNCCAITDLSEGFMAFASRAQWDWKPPKDEAQAAMEYYPVGDVCRGK